MVGCAAIIGIIAFAIGCAIGLAVSLFVGGFHWSDPLMSGALTSAIAFVAAFLLYLRDRCRYKLVVKQIHRKLLNRPDLELGEFCKSFPFCNPGLLADIREAIAGFFEVPPAKIHPTDHFRRDYRVDTIGPGFQFYIVSYVLIGRNITLRNFPFRENMEDLGVFINEVQNLLNTRPSDADEKGISEK